ncbi:MAG: TRAP transporter large permease, partial [Ruminococcaceae bacterium]|nr:TRAP transporter large permease [Oscillospiraceae bacterium]
MNGGFGLLLILFVMLFTGIPVALGIVLSVLIGYSVWMSTPWVNIGQAMVSYVNNFALMSVYFYILAGQFLSHGRIAEEIVGIFTSLVGKKRGGIAIAAVLACAMFGAVSGSTTATLVCIGGLMFPVMRKAGYSPGFCCSVLLGAATLGIIVPPSIPEVMYGFITGVSIFKLFISGVIPAAIIVILYVFWIRSKCKEVMIVEGMEYGFKPFLKACKSGIWALLFPCIIFGGIITGFYTSNEAAVLAASYAFIIELFVYKSITLKESKQYFIDATITTAACMVLVAVAGSFSEAITYLRVPAAMVAFCEANVGTKAGFLLMVNIMLLICGMLIDNTSSILILTPVLYPLAQMYGVDPVHFGFLMNLN